MVGAERRGDNSVLNWMLEMIEPGKVEVLDG
jgi:hypothetical protein